MPNLRTLLIAAMLATLVAAAAARAEGPSADPAGMKPLSDERTVTRWAYPGNHGKIRSRPTARARTIARLHWLTEDHLPEIYIALASWVDAHGNPWVKIRVPKRPNGITGWVPRGSLRQYTVVREFLDIDRRTLRATLYRSGALVMSARVGIGSSANPTPAGRFYIREKFRVTTSPVYGPYAMGTSAYAPRLTDWPGGGVVGLHGTNEPGLIPGRPSHGCIRLRNASITRLYRLTPRGTPISIHD
jgi:lipoprotein-anchoring transpeptidase ErfK/SrfK